MLKTMLSILMVLSQTSPAPNYQVPIHGKGSHIETPDGRLYYEKEGSGPAVFVVAGGPGSSHVSFHPWFSRLAASHTVVYFDNIGRGRSDRLKDASRYTVRRDAEDIEALRKALGFESISLIGHSYGGYPAMAYALAFPQRVTKLVLSDTLFNDASWQVNIDSVNYNTQTLFPDVWAKLMEMRRKGMLSSVDEYQDLYGTATRDFYWYDVANASKMFRSGDSADGFNSEIYFGMIGSDPEWKVGGTMKGYDPSKAMRQMKTPTLIIVGRADRVAPPSISAQIRDLIPNSRLEYFDKSGHRPWVEEPDRYFQIVGNFLK